MLENLREEKTKQKELYDEQMLAESKLIEEIQSRMQQEMACMEELHEKERKYCR